MKFRKAAAATLAVTVLAAAAPISGNLPIGVTASAETIVGESSEYEFETDTEGSYLKITSYIGEGGNVTIPDKLNGTKVTGIGNDAFAYRESLTSVVIPDSVTEMGNSAFTGCTSLTEVTIGKSVAAINYSTFYGCAKLKTVTIPDSVTSIGAAAFEGCTALTDITIPASVNKVEGSAFWNTGLKNIKGAAGSYAEAFAKENGFAFNGVGGTEKPLGTNPYREISNGDYVWSAEGTPDDSYTVSNSIYGRSDASRLFDGDILKITIKPAAGYALVSASTEGKGWEEIYEPNAEGNIVVEYTAQYLGGIAGVQAGSLITHGLYVKTKAVEVDSSDVESSDVESSDVESSDAESSDVESSDVESSDVESSSDTESSDTSAKDVFEDKDTNITVSTDDGVIPDGAVLTVDEIEDKSDNDTVTYDISFKDKGGNVVTPMGGGLFVVTMPVPEVLKGKDVKVYREEANGKYTDMNAKVENGTVSFTTDHFSIYILTAEALGNSSSDSNSSGSGSDSPDTGFAGVTLTLGVIALAGAAVLVSRKKTR